MEPRRAPMQPAYFQTTRLCLAYFNDKDAYSADEVTGYLNGLRDRLGSELVRLVGVSADGRDFDYIGRDWWIDELPAERRAAAQFLRSACGTDPATANTGEAYSAVWFAGFSALFAGTEGLRRTDPRPVFGIIDSDSAHHLSAALVERALQAIRGTGTARPTLVINFDRHWDYNAAAPGDISCQKWGYFALRPGKGIDGTDLKRTALADAYLQFGDKSSPETGSWQRKSADGEKPPTQTTPWGDRPVSRAIDPTARTIGAQLAAVAGSFPDAAVDAYVSVDRDFVKESYTPYDDGNYPSDVGLAAVRDCLAGLQQLGARLIGFDVCGLPVRNGAARSRRDRAPAALVKLADDEIVRMWGWVSQYLRGERVRD